MFTFSLLPFPLTTVELPESAFAERKSSVSRVRAVFRRVVDGSARAPFAVGSACPSVLLAASGQRFSFQGRRPCSDRQGACLPLPVTGTLQWTP